MDRAPIAPRSSALFTGWYNDAQAARGDPPRKLPLIVLNGQPPAFGKVIGQADVAYQIKEPWEPLDTIASHVFVEQTGAELELTGLKMVGMMGADGKLQAVPSDIRGSRLVMPIMVAHNTNSGVGGRYFCFADDNGDDIYQNTHPIPVYQPMIKRMAAPDHRGNKGLGAKGGGLAGLNRPLGTDDDFVDLGGARTPCQRLPKTVSQTGGRSGYDQARFQRDRKLRTGQVDANRLHEATLPPAAGGPAMAASVVDINITVSQSNDYDGAVAKRLVTEMDTAGFVSTSDPSLKFGKKDNGTRLWANDTDMSSSKFTIKLPADLCAGVINGVEDASLRFSEKHTHGCSVKDLRFFKSVEERLIEMSPQPPPSEPHKPPPSLPLGWDKSSGPGSLEKKEIIAEIKSRGDPNADDISSWTRAHLVIMLKTVQARLEAKAQGEDAAPDTVVNAYKWKLALASKELPVRGGAKYAKVAYRFNPSRSKEAEMTATIKFVRALMGTHHEPKASAMGETKGKPKGKGKAHINPKKRPRVDSEESEVEGSEDDDAEHVEVAAVPKGGDSSSADKGLTKELFILVKLK